MNHDFPTLISLLNGETLSIEYKRDLDIKNKQNPLASGAIASSLMALGNTNGGYLLLGVDNGGKVLGVNQSRTGSLASLCREIGREFLIPPPIDFQVYEENNKRVFAFFLSPAQLTPYQLTDGALKIRKDQGNKQGPENLPFLLTELPQWQAQRGIHYDFTSTLLPELAWKDYSQYLDLVALQRLKRRIDEGKTDPNLVTISTLEQRMDALGLVGTIDGERVLTYGAILLLGC